MATGWKFPVRVWFEDGKHRARCDLLPEAIASGATHAEAVESMRHGLIAAVRGRIGFGMELPRPPEADPAATDWVPLPVRLAAKASVYAAWRESGLTKVALAERLGRGESDVRRILDLDHGTKLDQIEEVAAALGQRVVLHFEPA